MKLPTVWIAGAFAAGIGLATAIPRHLSAGAWVALCLAAILLSAVFVWRGFTTTAWVSALAAWLLLGAAAVALERASVPANHVTRLIAAARLDTSEPLRWRGRLREDPITLPWGHRYEIDLEQVEVNARTQPVRGGLRANLYAGPRSEQAPAGLRAGDRVEMLLRARPPRNFLDPGAFDLRAYLALQQIDLTGTLRGGQLIRLIDRPPPAFLHRLARVRGDLLARLDSLFAGRPRRAAVLRAMLLGDRSFVDSDTVTAFQKTSAYHILVVAGLHVGALVAFLFWLGRRMRLGVAVTSLVTLAALAAYVGVVQDRPPILRAALIAAFYLAARPLFRGIALLNTIALAALALLVWKPSSLIDSSFQLSFAAAAVIAGLAIPWIGRTSAPYRAGLRHLGDVTRDAAHPPHVAQFRIEMRAAANWIASRAPQTGRGQPIASRVARLLALPVLAALRVWEIVLLSLVIQWGMMPLLAQDFHRVSLAGPVSNIPAVILTGAIVPLGFLTLLASFAWATLATSLAHAVGFCVGLLLETVDWFSRVPHASYRIPGPPLWLAVAFFLAFVLLAWAATRAAERRFHRGARRMLPPPIALAEFAAAAVLLALTILVATHPFPPSLVPGKFELSVLDVGQGDSIFTAFPDGRTMLIDGGGLTGSERVGGYRSGLDVGEDVVSPYLWSRGLRRIDVIALTHAHHDHLGGLHSVIENFQVGELWIGRDEETPEFKSLMTEAHARGVKVLHKIRGDSFNWNGVTGAFLWPPDIGPMKEASNDDSLVMRITDGSLRFLLAGDAQQRAEDEIVRDGAALEADFLKVPHHGSKTSSTPSFLAAVKPRLAVVSVGEGNPFGHPAESILERYAQAGVRLLRTDHDGVVTVLADGKNLTYQAFVSAAATQPSATASAAAE